MKKVLIISYFFPPVNTPGSHRVRKFVKYLNQFDWSPIVLTVKNGDSVGRPLDFSLLEDLPSGKVVVIRTHTTEPLRVITKLAKRWHGKDAVTGSNQAGNSQTSAGMGFLARSLMKWVYEVLIRKPLSVPDEYVGWAPFAALKGIGTFHKHRPEVIFSSSPPLSCHLVGLILKKAFNIPWVADFRDIWPWLFDINRNFFEKIENQLVEIVLKNADKIITISDAMKEELFLKYPSVSQEKYHVIENGFDPDDYKNIFTKTFDKFTILHAGEVYYQRNPYAVLDALRELVASGQLGQDFQIIFLGTIYKRFLKQNDILKDFVKLQDPVSHDKALSYILGADVLLLLIGEDKSHTIGYTSKFFEYMFANKPILAISPGGPLSELVKDAKVGFTYKPDERDSIKRCMLDLYLCWKNGNLVNDRDENIVAQFHRRVLTEKLARVLTSAHNNQKES